MPTIVAAGSWLVLLNTYTHIIIMYVYIMHGHGFNNRVHSLHEIVATLFVTEIANWFSLYNDLFTQQK